MCFHLTWTLERDPSSAANLNPWRCLSPCFAGQPLNIITGESACKLLIYSDMFGSISNPWDVLESETVIKREIIVVLQGRRVTLTHINHHTAWSLGQLADKYPLPCPGYQGGKKRAILVSLVTSFFRNWEQQGTYIPTLNAGKEKNKPKTESALQFCRTTSNT